MSLPVSFYSLTYADNSVNAKGKPETTTTEFPIATLTAANLVAKTTLIDNLGVAIQGLVIGNLLKATTIVERETIGSGPAASQLAQRENKYLMRYHDNVTLQNFQVSVGTADLTILPNHSEFLDLTTGGGADLKTAFEAIVVSPDNAANAVTLDSVQFVGRNT